MEKYVGHEDGIISGEYSTLTRKKKEKKRNRNKPVDNTAKNRIPREVFRS